LFDDRNLFKKKLTNQFDFRAESDKKFNERIAHKKYQRRNWFFENGFLLTKKKRTS
jgi:hypothetical protein